MDWFHCNRCFLQRGARFSVTTCGHVLCQRCGAAAGPCVVCGAQCRTREVGNQLHPDQRRFFRSPTESATRALTQLSQAAQAELRVTRQREAAERARRDLQEAQRELQTLRRENAELRRAQLSPVWPSRGSAPRPVGVTSPASTAPAQRRQLSGQTVSRSASATPPGERPPFRAFFPRATPPSADATPPFPPHARWLAGAHRSA
ncbi:E3 ubiquitin-protein ligase RNF212B isoform X7 [Patagioenas fasciata]|uniref:E3 ubiquitin-protein ligase RNF212B isoform X7 n=1 Tax=Patagioenas fasciata TaxID=372321 RepID=UPI003A99EE60